MLDVLLEGQIPGLVTWLGTVFGLIGLRFTFLQAQAARRLAERAVRGVVELNERTALARAGVAASQLDTLRMVAESGHHDVAASLVSPLRRSMIQISSAAHFDHGTGENLIVPLRNLKTIDTQLSLAIAGSINFKRGLIIKALVGLDEHLGQMEVKLLQKTEGLNDAKS